MLLGSKKFKVSPIKSLGDELVFDTVDIKNFGGSGLGFWKLSFKGLVEAENLETLSTKKIAYTHCFISHIKISYLHFSIFNKQNCSYEWI